MPASRKRSSWFVTLPIVAGAVGFLLLVFFPTARAIRQTRNEIRTKQEFLTQTQSLRATMLSLESDLKEINQFADAWELQAPVPGQMAKLFGKITRDASEYGVVPARFDPLKEIPLHTMHRVPVQMELNGSYTGIAQLLAALEQLPETVWIDHLKFEKDRQAGKDVKCEVKLEVFAVNPKKSD
jgi:Tfp pilus assembly protein PilO